MTTETPATKGELQSLRDDVSDMKDALVRLADAYTKLAILEERQANSKSANERAFELIEKLTTRVHALEQQAPIHKQSSEWVNKAIGLLIAALIGAAVTANFGPRRDVAAPPVIERKQ